MEYSHEDCSRKMFLMFVLISGKCDLSLIFQKCILYSLSVLKTLHSELQKWAYHKSFQ